MALKTIAIEEADFARLEPLKVHPRETYGDVIHRLLDLAEEISVPSATDGTPSLAERLHGTSPRR